jgi:hypothetical protein
MPRKNITIEVVNQLLHNFKLQATATMSTSNQQQTLKNNTHTQRMQTETNQTSSQRAPITAPLPTVKFDKIIEPNNSHTKVPPLISQDDDIFRPPTSNTWHQQTSCTLTQDKALHIKEFNVMAKQSLAQ